MYLFYNYVVLVSIIILNQSITVHVSQFYTAVGTFRLVWSEVVLSGIYSFLPLPLSLDPLSLSPTVDHRKLMWHGLIIFLYISSTCLCLCVTAHVCVCVFNAGQLKSINIE